MSDIRTIRRSISEIGEAVRHPRDLARRWRSRELEAPPALLVALLLANGVVGMAAYGVTMKMHLGLHGMLEGAFFTPLAAGLAWCISLPALYIGKRLLGSTVRFGEVLFTASITVSFGSSAMLASAPVNWFFTLATPWTAARLAVNVLIFVGVGFCMRDVLWRAAEELFDDGPGLYAGVWLALHVTIGVELFVAFGVFQF